MPRYVTRPKAWADNYWDMTMPDRPSATVFEASSEPQETGLYDANGDRLFRVYDREPIGFLANRRAS